MKNFFENVKEFCSRNFKQISFAVFVAIGTIFALLSNYAANQGYGNLFTPVNDNHRHTYHNERYHNERRDRNNSKRQPWTMQKPDSKRSSKNSNSSNHK